MVIYPSLLFCPFGRKVRPQSPPLPPPRSHKCVAQDTLTTPPLLNGGVAFATAKIHPSVLASLVLPPSFCLRSSRRLSRDSHVSAFGDHSWLRQALLPCFVQPFGLSTDPPCPVLRTPRVAHVWATCS